MVKKNKTILKIIILTLFICLISSNVFAKTIKKEYTIIQDEDLNQIQNELTNLGYKGENVAEAIINAKVQNGMDASTKLKEWGPNQWEYEGKKYTASVEWFLGNVDGKVKSVATLSIDVIEENSPPDVNLGESNPWDDYDYIGTSFEDLNKQIQDALALKQSNANIEYYYKQYAKTTATEKYTKKSFTAEWESDTYKYKADIEEYEVFSESKFYAKVKINKETKPEEIITQGKPNTEGKPDTDVLGTSNPSAGHSPDEIKTEADSFIEIGKNNGNPIDGDNLKKASDTLYNILLTIGIILAVGVGMYLAIKFMLSSAEDKAKVKESLVPYIAGCVVIFGAFIIWKLVVMLLGTIN